MEVCHGGMPVDWTVQGDVTWKMALGVPDQIWGDAQDVCALDVYPTIRFCWTDQPICFSSFQSPILARTAPLQTIGHHFTAALELEVCW